MPFDEWPQLDGHAWERATTKGDVFDESGRGASWADQTKTTNIQHYGRWLGYLAYIGELSVDGSPADRVTKVAVDRYYKHLIALGTTAPRTRLSMLVGLKETIRAMAPERNWRWLQDMCNHVQRNAAPSREKQQRVRSSIEIYEAALQGLAESPANLTKLAHLIDYRDHLMLALLAARPLRKKNFALLNLDRHVVRRDAKWLITIQGDEIKNGQAVEFWIPDDLVVWFERYLTEIRPLFPGAESSTQLWLTKDGPAIGSQFLYWRITKLTKRLLGATINPHLLRDCAATTLAMESADLALTAPALLGHRHASTTARYYVQARNLDASRKINNIMDAVKTQLETVE
tara:strand:- start:658 stop:1692 length:1035 start_codon:yes stop_codon:yes gene_type:complete